MELPDNFYDQLYIGLNYFCRHYREGKPIESDEYEDEYEDCIQFSGDYCAEVSLDVVVMCEFSRRQFRSRVRHLGRPGKGLLPQWCESGEDTKHQGV